MVEKIAVTVAEAEARFEELIEAVERGARVVILRDGEEAVRLVPYRGEGVDGLDGS